MKIKNNKNKQQKQINDKQPVRHSPDLIVATHLYYDLGSKPLRAQALAEEFIKALYLSESGCISKIEWKQNVARLVGLRAISDEDTELAIGLLLEKGFINKTRELWSLEDITKKNINDEIVAAELRINKILKKHFSIGVDQREVLSWFKEATADFFTEYGKMYSKILLRQKISLPDISQLENILEKSVKGHDLGKKKTDLLGCFICFLKDDDPDITKHIWSLAQSMISARVISATTGPDPFSVDEFSGAKILVDTNILILAAIEEGINVKTFSALANSLKEIDATLHIIRTTKDEYESLILRKRASTLKVLAEGESIETLKVSGDLFIQAAITLGCKEIGDFERFYDSIQRAPENVDGVDIKLEDFPDVEKSIELGLKNTKVQSEISAEWAKLHKSTKHIKSIEHDATLNSVALQFREKEDKSFVLTRDRSMQNYSIRNTDHKHMPMWIPIELLIQILATYGAGPTHNPEDFAPLLRLLIESEFQTRINTFEIEDLRELIEIDQRAIELNLEDKTELATLIKRLRFEGKLRNSGEIQRALQRKLQLYKLSETEQVLYLQEQVKTLVHKEQIQIQNSREELIKELIPKQRRKIYLKYILILLMVIILGFMLMYLSWYFWNTERQDLAVTVAIALLFEMVVPLLSGIPKLRKELSSVQENSEREADKRIQG